MVVQHCEATFLEEFAGPGVVHAAFDEFRSGGHVLPAPGGQIVEHGDFPAVLDIEIGDVRCDESRTTGHQNSSRHRVEY